MAIVTKKNNNMLALVTQDICVKDADTELKVPDF